MRIADTLLRRGHLSEDALVDAWYTGDHPGHLDTCELCAARALSVSRWLEQTRDLGMAEADAAFPAERLATQQSQILRKLEQIDRPAKLLSFPLATAHAAAHPELGGGHRVSTGWIAAAAAAGIILGVIGGRLSVWQPAPQTARTAVESPTTAKAQTPESPRAVDAVDLLDADTTQPQVRSLSAIDTLMTEGGQMARVSTRRR